MNKTDKIINALNEQPKFITILKNKPSRIEKILAWFGYKRLIKRTFEVTPLTLFNKFRISSLCLKFNLPEMVDLEVAGDQCKISFDDKNANKLEILLKNLYNNMKYFALIIAITLVNGRKAPEEKLIRFIYENITTDDVTQILPLIISSLDLSFFLSTLILIDRENLLKEPEKEKKIKH